MGQHGVTHPLPKRLREAGVSAASVTQVSNIVLGQAGSVRVTKESFDTSCYAGTFGLSSPNQQVIWTNYGDYPGGQPPVVSPIANGTPADIGSFSSGVGLVFYINTYTPGAVCANQTYLSTDPNAAQVYQTGTDSWTIYWEDNHVAPNIDDNDLVVRVERLPRDVTVPASAAMEGPDAPNQHRSADPVNTYTGTYTYTRTDLALAGRGPSPTFARAYNSNDTRVTDLGPGWTHNYNVYIGDPADGTGDRYLIGPDGRSDRYTHNPDGSYTPPPALTTTLVMKTDLTYTATTSGQRVWTFDGYGRLLKITDRYGNASVLGYNANRQLVSISDAAGRGSLSLSYNTAGLLASVTDWMSPARSVQFGYDASGRLHSVTDRAGKITTYGYDGTTSRLTTITDANGHVAVTMTYDVQGRVATQKDALGLTTGQQTTFTYPASQPGATTVTYPATSYDGYLPTVADTYDAQARVTQRVSRPSATETSSVSFTYDANGNSSSTTDARGTTSFTCWDIDYSGAPTSSACACTFSSSSSLAPTATASRLPACAPSSSSPEPPPAFSALASRASSLKLHRATRPSDQPSIYSTSPLTAGLITRNSPPENLTHTRHVPVIKTSRTTTRHPGVWIRKTHASIGENGCPNAGAHVSLW